MGGFVSPRKNKLWGRGLFCVWKTNSEGREGEGRGAHGGLFLLRKTNSGGRGLFCRSKNKLRPGEFV